MEEQRSDRTKPNIDVHKKKQQQQQRSSKCFVYAMLATVLHSIAMLVLANTVLRIKSPQLKLSSVSVKSLRYVTGQSPSFNATMTAVMTVKNDNFGGFKFENSSSIIVHVMYENVTTIGDIKIGMRRVGSRDTEHVNVVAVLQVRMRPSGVLLTLADEMLSSDINSGSLKLSSYGTLRGEVRVMKMIRTHTTAEMNCSMSLNFTSRAIQDLLCM